MNVDHVERLSHFVMYSPNHHLSPAILALLAERAERELELLKLRDAILRALKGEPTE